jgi:hypothetical protein
MCVPFPTLLHPHKKKKNTYPLYCVYVCFSHLPVNIVASSVKRTARLSLFAPPPQPSPSCLSATISSSCIPPWWPCFIDSLTQTPRVSKLSHWPSQQYFIFFFVVDFSSYLDVQEIFLCICSSLIFCCWWWCVCYNLCI